MGKDIVEYQEPTDEVSRPPLLLRLNRLDSLMKRLGGTKNLWGINKSRRSQEDDHDVSSGASRLDGKCFVPLNVAIQEACSKGSLLDRIASLEDRLVQLCLDIESYRKSRSSVNSSSGASSSSNSGSKTERMSSYPTFSSSKSINPQCKKLPQLPTSAIPHDLEPQKSGISSSIKQHTKAQGSSSKDKKTGRKGKKNNVAPSWPHFKILGC